MIAEIFTVHETKTNQLGTFACRVVGIRKGNAVLLVRPCLKPQCPDLGFKKITSLELSEERFKEKRPLSDLEEECLKRLANKLEEEDLAQIDQEFSRKWFDEIARVTDLSQFQNAWLSQLVKSRS